MALSSIAFDRNPDLSMLVAANDQSLSARETGRQHDVHDATGNGSDVRFGAGASVESLSLVTHVCVQFATMMPRVASMISSSMNDDFT
jgi:hypothetical protein